MDIAQHQVCGYDKTDKYLKERARRERRRRRPCQLREVSDRRRRYRALKDVHGLAAAAGAGDAECAEAGDAGAGAGAGAALSSATGDGEGAAAAAAAGLPGALGSAFWGITMRGEVLSAAQC